MAALLSTVNSANSGSRFSENASGPSSWSGWPHTGSAPSRRRRRHASVSPISSRAPQRPLGGAHRRRRVLRDRLGQLLRRSRSRSGGSTIFGDHPELVRPLRRHPLVAPGERHAHHRLDRHLVDEADRLVRGDLADRDVRVEEGGGARRRSRCRRRRRSAAHPRRTCRSPPRSPASRSRGATR